MQVIELSDAVDIEKSEAKVEVLEKHSEIADVVRITQTITLSCEIVVVSRGSDPWRCGACGSQANLPDSKGAEFLLRNVDTGRLNFPGEEDCREERDSWPVTGWKKIKVYDKEILTCRKCVSECDDATAEVIRKKVETKNCREAGIEVGKMFAPGIEWRCDRGCGATNSPLHRYCGGCGSIYDPHKSTLLRKRTIYCNPYCGKKCPNFGKPTCSHHGEEKFWCSRKCRDAKKPISPRPRGVAWRGSVPCAPERRSR